MILVVLAIGAILLVSALRNTYGALFAALEQDVPQYVVWAAAIVALGAIGFIPGLRPISRGLMALVLIVIVLQNYTKILAGFQSVSKPPANNNSSSSGSSTSGTGDTSGPLQVVVRGATPDYSALDYETPPSAFSSASVGH